MQDILDIGDQVTELHGSGKGVVVEVQQVGKERLYGIHWHGDHIKRTHAQRGWSREQLMRVGGDLQRGDFVLIDKSVPVWGGAQAVLLAYEGVGVFDVFVLGHDTRWTLGIHLLTRIPRAEVTA